jgi:IS605 OrfB family transposase
MKALKREFIADGVTARHFNALRISVEATINGAREAMKLQIDDAETRVKAIDRKLAALAKKPPTARRRNEIHQRKRRRAILLNRVAKLRDRIGAPTPGIGYGSRRLFNAQHHLALNGYADHAEWRTDWQAERSNHILIVGAACETAGNLNAQGRIEADGSVAVKLRLPDALISQFGKHVELRGLRFDYGRAAVAAALSSAEQTPVTWRFVHDAKGWRAFVTVHETHTEKVSDTAHGAVGVDVNADHLAVAVADAHGNPIAWRRVQTTIIGKTADQRKAIYGDAAKQIVSMALSRRMPLVLERLDFKRKKAELETEAWSHRSRTLSALAYIQIGAMIRARALRLGVRVIEVSPTYTSLIGDAKFAVRYGASVHLSAALAIARRGMSLSERMPAHPSVSLGDGARVTLVRPARNGRRHVWASWAGLARRKKAALAGRARLARGQSSAARPRSAARRRGPAV